VIVETGPGWELRLGDYREVLADVTCQAVICDPPYGDRTHSGQRHGRFQSSGTGDWATARGIGYAHWTLGDVRAFCSWASGAASGWVCAQTSHDLVPHYEAALSEAGRYVFKPVPIVMKGMNIRLAGDGPSSWSVDMVVARPSSRDWLAARKAKRDALDLAGTLPGAYVGLPWDEGQNSATAERRESVVGSKPLWLMRAIVRDYSEPGDLVCDPCAGGGTTLLAAVIEGRRAIGAERDPDTFAKAVARLRRGYTPTFDFGAP
jgi:hypothetical protein